MLIKKYSIKQFPVQQIVYINCKDAIYGRLLSFVAKLSTLESIKKIYMFNLDGIIIKSKPELIVQYYKQKINRGVGYGPFYPKSKEKFIKYILRSMYPKTKMGALNYKKVITWIIPNTHNKTVLYFEKPLLKRAIKYENLLIKIRSK